eukprot:scaffold315023_cov28-Tisochrysis_lutea.AAC.2
MGGVAEEHGKVCADETKGAAVNHLQIESLRLDEARPASDSWRFARWVGGRGAWRCERWRQRSARRHERGPRWIWRRRW